MSDELVKIARAQQRGTLPTGLAITASSNGYIEITVGRSHYDARQEVKDGCDVLAWARRNFPDGKVRSRPAATIRRRQGFRPTRIVFHDLLTYDSGKVSVTYPVPHECRHFKADTRDISRTASDMPVWYCAGCSKPITVTEARKRGLLPPRAAR